MGIGASAAEVEKPVIEEPESPRSILSSGAGRSSVASTPRNRISVMSYTTPRGDSSISGKETPVVDPDEDLDKKYMTTEKYRRIRTKILCFASMNLQSKKGGRQLSMIGRQDLYEFVEFQKQDKERNWNAVYLQNSSGGSELEERFRMRPEATIVFSPEDGAPKRRPRTTQVDNAIITVSGQLCSVVQVVL